MPLSNSQYDEIFRKYDEKGRPELYWGQQQIAA